MFDMFKLSYSLKKQIIQLSFKYNFDLVLSLMKHISDNCYDLVEILQVGIEQIEQRKNGKQNKTD